MTRRKIALVGAGGVGATVAYASLIRGVGREIALYDINAAKVAAEVLDLNHGLRFTPTASVVGSDDIEVCRGADVVVVTAGAKQAPGESRLDLAGRNVAILRDLVPRLVALSPEAILLLVTNPVDVLTYVALRLSGLPRRQVLGSGTVLDTSRLHYLLAERCGVAVTNVHGYIVGEHGDSEFPLWSSASIGAVPLSEWSNAGGGALDASALEEIGDEVKNAAYRIIAGKGATTYAIGLATTAILQAILTDAHQVMPVSSLQDGIHGLRDVCLSMPSVINRHGVDRVLELPLTDDERTALRTSATTIMETIRAVGF